MLITGLAGTPPQDLDLETMQLLMHFFTVEELVNDLQLLDLNIRELTVLKSVILQEIARQVSQQATVRDAVRASIQSVASLIGRRPTR